MYTDRDRDSETKTEPDGNTQRDKEVEKGTETQRPREILRIKERVGRKGDGLGWEKYSGMSAAG